jgi:hypothetical protein
MLSASASAWERPVSYFASVTGGAYNHGAVYEVVGMRRRILYSFCPNESDGCKDGAAPLANVIKLADGSLVGTTADGGDYSRGPVLNGVIFKLEPLPDGSWSQRVLYSFCPWWQECDHYGKPTGGITLVNGDTIEGLMQTDDGQKGLKWKFIMSPKGDAWFPVQHWGKTIE